MLILALESSAKAASVALCRDGVLIAQSQQCSGLTHSCTLLPMAEQMLKNTDTKLADVDAIAVARGPGSFTGVRIGVSTAKGLAWGAQKPAIGVSTLEPAAARSTTPCSRSGAENRCAFVKTVRFRSRSWAKNWEKCRNPFFWLATAHSCVIIHVWTWAFPPCWRRAIWSARARGAWPWPPSGRRRPRRRNCSRSICACRRPSGNARHGWLLRRRKNEKLNQQRRRRDE